MGIKALVFHDWKRLVSKNHLLVPSSQRGVFSAADDQWRSASRPGSTFLHDSRDWQRCVGIHPPKRCESPVRSPTHAQDERLDLEFFSWQETFAVAVSVSTGRIVYISDQAASILNCSKDTFTTTKFVEFLKPRDVGVFYNSTSPSRLPSWKMHGSGREKCLQAQTHPCTKLPL